MQQNLQLISGILIPTFLELTLSSATVLIFCGPTYFFNLVISLGVYFWVTKRISTQRKQYLQKQLDIDKKSDFMISESLQNYYNVQIFDSKKFELSKYTSVVRERITSSSMSQEYLAKLNLMQKSVIVCGSMLNIMLCLWGVYKGNLTAGDIILLTNIMFQVFGPLSNLGMIYQKWQESFLEINALLELFELKSKVVETENAKEFEFRNGDIQFANTDLSFGTFQSVRLKDSQGSELGSQGQAEHFDHGRERRGKDHSHQFDLPLLRPAKRDSYDRRPEHKGPEVQLPQSH